MENSKNKWGTLQTVFTLLASLIAFSGIFGILKIIPIFSTEMKTLSSSFSSQFNMMFSFFGAHSFVILPDLLTQSVLFGFIAFNSIKTRISSALLATIGIMGILYYVVNVLLSTGQGIQFDPKTLLFVAPSLVILIIALITNKFSAAPLNTLEPTEVKKSVSFFPYFLFNKISIFTQNQQNTIAGTITQALLFVITGKIVAFLFFLLLLVIVPLAAYIVIWTLVAVGVIIGVYFILKIFVFGSDTSRYSSSYAVAEQPVSEQVQTSIGGCPFKGRVLADSATTVMGFNWPSKETIFEIDSDWTVSNSKGFQGWVDKNGSIHEGHGGTVDINATLSGNIIAKISGDSCYAGSTKIGSKVNW